MSHRKVLSALTLILALTAAPAFAEDQHHSAGSAPAAAPAPQGMQGMVQGTQGGMNQGGMGMMGMQEGGMQNMPMMGMRQGGMQQGGMPMMMCNMMRGAGMGGMPMGDMPIRADHTEGRIAFLKTELKITDAQLPLWNAVADALRANAKSGMGMMDNMGQGSLTERLAAREKHLAAQAEALRKVMFGFLLQWPTLLTLAMFPVLVVMYVRLARTEEREAIREFGDAYPAYMAEVPGFIPRQHKPEPPKHYRALRR